VSADRPNALWSIDFKGQFRTRDQRYCYPLTVSDGYSRDLLLCRGLASTEGAPVRVWLVSSIGVMEPQGFRHKGASRFSA
jgi:hypothetical protein